MIIDSSTSSTPSSDIPPAIVAALNEQLSIQQTEIERLQKQLENLLPFQGLRNSILLTAAAAKITSAGDHDPLLQAIVEAAANIIPSPAATLMLVDEGENNLVFQVATGSKTEELMKLHVPIGHGLAGMVAATGQAMIINNSFGDSRQADDISKRVGYKPRRLMCVPLVTNDRVAGVLELLDKDEDYTNDDIHTLSLFSELCAIAIEQSVFRHGTARIISDALLKTSAAPEEFDEIGGSLTTAFDSTAESAEFQWSIETAEIVSDIAQFDERAGDACQAMLREFRAYLGKTAARRR